MNNPQDDWKYQKCGDDRCWSAMLSDTEKYLSKSRLALTDDALSSADYCPECFWFLVTGKEPTPDELPIMREQRGYGINKVPPGKYGPYDDTSPGDENATRAREGE